MRLFCAGFPLTYKDEDLNDLFTSFGAVAFARVVVDHISYQSRGFGFVEMPDEKQAFQAIRHLNGSLLENRRIKVDQARRE